MEDETSSKEQIVVLDEFDQLEGWLNSPSFADNFKSFLNSIGSKVKYIMISNKSIHSFEDRPENVLKNIIKYSRIV
jgi:hypothetical protein